MNVKESINSAFSSVLSNKMRSILTMLGIIIGISSVILITSIGNGITEMTEKQFAELGYNGLQIYAMSSYDGKYVVTEKDKITMDDVELIKKNEGISSVSVMTSFSGTVKLKNPNEEKVLDIYGTDKYYTDVRYLEIVSGRFLNESDNLRNSKVVLIDENTSTKIFGHTNTVGETIEIEINDTNTDFTIIGILKSKEEVDEFTLIYEPTTAYIPINTLFQMVESNYKPQLYLLAKVKDDYDMKIVSKEVEKILAIKHNTDQEKYYAQDIGDAISEISTLFGQITAFISFVAGISLFVGGVGVMNIMLVTVTERTREIGIRKSLGATNGNIQFQFLIESIILTAIGGLIGIILGYVGGIILGNQLNITPVMSIPIVIGVVAISSIIGIVFGVYPANKAANLDPIEALRYE